MSLSINDGLLGKGVDLMGCELDLADALALARKDFKWMPLCVVEDWVILDAILTDEEQAKVAAAGCQPMFLFAHKVVHDEQRRFEPGDWVRSTIAQTFKDGYLFGTRNTIYVLKGPGYRKSSNLQGIFSIF
ncbi:DUF6957 family protein [Pseudomonas putida]|uniref:DUF6957 family protein n=1 Tax=Pseudomonas putida TaxID=303 RepID=UPI0039E13279